MKNALPCISSSANESPLYDVNIVINRKNLIKQKNQNYQNQEKNKMKSKLGELQPRDTSNDRKKYNLSPSEFQSEQEMLLLEQRKQKLIDKQNE